MELTEINPDDYIKRRLSQFEGLFLRCGVCLRFLTVPPIHFSSSNGMKICGRCFRGKRYFRHEKDIEKAELIRDTLYEQFAKLFIFPCSYFDCRKMVKFGDSADHHETTCKNKGYVCPISLINRWFARSEDKERCDCLETFPEEKEMIEHVETDHVNYLLPGPFLHYRYIFLPFEKRRMFISISEGKIAVLFSRKVQEKFCVIRCRTFSPEGTDVCEINVKDLQTGRYIRKCNILCGPLDGEDSDDADQVFMIRLDVLPPRAMFHFHIRERKGNEKLNDSKENHEDSV